MLDEDKTREQLISELCELRERLAESERDKEERKQVEEALRESEYRFKMLYDGAPMPYQSLDQDGNLISVNQAWLDVLGYDREEVIGRNFASFLHPAWDNHFRVNFPKFKAAGEILGVEFEMVRKDGLTILVAFSGKIGLTPEGSFKQTHCIFKDITEQRQAEQRLQESEQRFRALFEHSPVAYQSLDAEGRYIDVNPELCALLDYSPDELLGRNFGEFWAESTREDFPEIFKTFKLDGRVSGELLLLARGGWLVSAILEGRVEKDSNGNFLRTHCILTDITERKQTEEKLRESEARIRSIIEDAPAGYFYIDLEGRFRQVNDAWLRLHGYESATEVIGQHFSLTQVSEDLESAKRNVELVLAGNPINSGEFTRRCKNGSVGYQSFTAHPVRKGGHVVGLEGFIIDTTKRKRTEDALLESEKKFKSFAEQALVGINVIQDGVFKYVNPKFAQMFGYTVEECLDNMPFEDLVHAEDAATVAEQIRKRTTGEVGFSHYNFRGLKKNNQICDVEVYGSSFAYEGKPATIGTVLDITERKRAEEALRESEVKYRNLFEQAPVGIFTSTSEGQLLLANMTLARILGLSSPQKTVEYYSDLQRQFYVNPGQRNQFLQTLQEKGYVENFEYEARTADGRIVWLSTNAHIAQHNADGSFLIEGFTTDITARRKLEEQFRQAQKMESVGRLAGGVAHDYNNMLGVILGYAELALDSVDPSHPLHNDLQEILKAAQRSAQVTRQLLAFARKQTIAPRPIDLNQTVEGMLRMLRRLIGEDIDLAWLPAMKLWSVKMDPSQIDQILANLCVNARDAIAGVGKITIETGTVTFDKAYCDDHPSFVQGDFVLLAVSDNGCGMDKETQYRLFEPFFTTKRVGQGTGLGLATVYGIVKQNNGFINVYSEPGQGSTFKIYLRRYQGEAVESGKGSAVPIPLAQGETVLVVEDETAVLNLSKSMLERLGYTVLTANTAGEVLRLAEVHAGAIHLLITDVVMPKMNGRELADAVKTFCPHLKTLFMSGYTANVIAHQGVLEEGICFIQKPFSRKDLAVKVRQALRKE